MSGSLPQNPIVIRPVRRLTAMGNFPAFLGPPRKRGIFLMTRRSPEAALQKQVIQWLALTLPPGTFWTSIDHAAQGLAQGAKRKARGVRAGLPDLYILHRGKSIWIELKAPKGILSPVQKAIHAELVQAGGIVFTAWDFDEVRDFVSMIIPVRDLAA